jgi:large subunit ribosomal protein L21
VTQQGLNGNFGAVNKKSFLFPFPFKREIPTFAVLILDKAMFAVVKIAGQQFRVQEGQSLYVPHLSGKNGDKVEFSDVLLTSNDNKIATDAKSVVKAEIVNEFVQGDKVIAFKMKRRKGFRKKHGHRTQYTQIKIESIN